MIDCINQSWLLNFVWTDPGWFFYQLEDWIVFYPRLHGLQLLVTKAFHFVFSCSLWRTDTIVFAKLNTCKPPVSIKSPSNVFEINKPSGGLNRGFTVLLFHPEKRTNKELNPLVASMGGLEPRPHWWEGSAFTTVPPSMFPDMKLFQP